MKKQLNNKTLPEKEQDILAAFILESLEKDLDKEIEKDLSKDGSLYWLVEEANLEIE